MDDANITRASSTGQISTLLLGHLFSPTSSTSSAPASPSSSPSRLVSVPPPHWGRQIPFSSFTSTPQNRGATTQGSPAALSAGFDPAAFLRSGVRMGPPAVDLDTAYDGESEEGAEVPEEQPKPTPTRSGSKRTRAAEVHNLSEKRRRSRINEKIKTLQNLIPNSNKTDKASMLDEAIEYLKHLQLQVQMLSMRNGISLQSLYLPSTLQAVQASQMHPGVSVNNSSSSNMGVGMMPAASASSSQSSFEISKHCTTAHQHMMPTTALTDAVTSIGMDSLQFQHESFPFSLPTEMYKEDTMRQSRLDAVHLANNMSDNAMNSMNVATTVPFEGEAPSAVDANLLDGCNLSCGKSEHLPSKGQQHQVLMQHLHSLQTGKGAASSDGGKVEMLEFR